MKIIVVSLFICYLVAIASGAKSSSKSSSNIKLDVFYGSTNYWLAIAVRNAGVDTRSVQIKESGSSTWQPTEFQSGWGYYTISSVNRLSFPVSVMLTSANGDQVTLDNVIRSTSVGTVDTGVKFGTSASTPRPAATSRPTNVPTVKSTNTNKATTKATIDPTNKPASTTRPTTAPTGKAATTTRPTAAPTAKPTTKTSTTTSGSGCAAPMKVMVPLYVYPGAQWDTVAASGRTVPTVAIINPNSGPGNGPDSTYITYMNKLYNAGVEIVGYVHTSWGARDIKEVKAEIDIYASQFPHMVGIFLDEAAATADQLSYYQQLYSYIMGMPGWKYDIINPGTVPVQGYLNAATQIVSFEDASSKFASSSNPSFASCSNKDKFAVITYGASSSGMQSAVNTAKSKGYYGWVYVTDGAAGCCTYNSITSYYGSMASYIASVN